MQATARTIDDDRLEQLVRAYLAKAGGDPLCALRLALNNALLDRDEAHRCIEKQTHLISRGFVRAGLSKSLLTAD